METIQETKVRTARKMHECSSCLWIRESIQPSENGFSFAEWRLIVAAKRDDWKILPGQKYEHTVNKHDGEIFTYKSRIGLTEICWNHELFDYSSL